MVLDCDTWPVPLVDLSTPEDYCVNGCVIPADTDSDLLEAASILAGTILRTLSGQRVGTCETTIRPLPECGVCRGHCVCSGAGDRIRLSSPQGPITAVSEVTVDGSPLLPDQWRYFPSGQLLYAVPPDVWPTQDVKWADCGDSGTMCVTAVIGYEPDAWALSVHAELTCELLKSCAGDECRIPRNATQVTGQGISITLSPTELKQFIPSVAGWVAAVNPNNAQSFAKVWSPDLMGCGGSGGGGDSSTGGTPVIDGGWA